MNVRFSRTQENVGADGGGQRLGNEFLVLRDQRLRRQK
jgi:hypothetical protein